MTPTLGAAAPKSTAYSCGMRISRTAAAIAAGCAIIIGLTGCSGGETNSSRPTASAARATSTPTPTPTAMSDAAAGEYYLASVCPTNKALAKLNAAIAGTDVAAVHTAAQEMIPITQDAARRFDAAAVLWPGTVEAKDVLSMQNYFLGTLTPLNGIVAAPTIEAANDVAWPDGTESSSAAQRMRLRLNLSADTSQGC